MVDLPAVSDRIPAVVHTPTEVQLFRFSAATWNPHRIHFDKPYAQSEGYPGVLVQSHLHAGYLVNLVLDWAGPHAILRRFGWQNRAVATPGDELRFDGTVSHVAPDTGEVTVDLSTTNQHGVLCVSAVAELVLSGPAVRSSPA